MRRIAFEGEKCFDGLGFDAHEVTLAQALGIAQCVGSERDRVGQGLLDRGFSLPFDPNDGRFFAIFVSVRI
jgi:hypothetical protein